MLTWEKKIDLIDKRLNNQLSESEELDFDEKVKRDSDFAALYSDMKLAGQALRHQALKRNYDALGDLEKSLPALKIESPIEEKNNNNFVGIKKLRSKWSAAAGFLLMIVAGSFFFLNTNDSPEEIYEEYFYAYPNMETERGLVQRTPSSLEGGNVNPVEKAYSFYDAKNYDAAIKAFQVLIKMKNDPQDYFFLGNSHMANNQMPEAIEVFRKLKDSPSDYQLRANWYLALAYLQSGKIEMATTLFQEIATTSDAPSYREKASDILKELN